MRGVGDFSMKYTSLTVCGFTHPSAARRLLEVPANAEERLAQRFLWFFPKPCYNSFEDLEPLDKDFSDDVGEFEVHHAT